MGDPRKIRRKYTGPSHPWQKKRIDEERELKREFGLKNKKEIWRMDSTLKSFKAMAKKLIASTSKNASVEKEQLMSRLASLGLITEGAQLDDVLSLSLRDLLERRLQTQAYKKGFARTMKQARQFITHEHILVNGTKITSPAYIVSTKEEAALGFSDNSALFDEEHPERKFEEEETPAEAAEKEAEAAKKKDAKKAKEKAAKKEVKKEEPAAEEKPAKKEEVPEDKKEEPKVEDKPAEEKAE